MKKYIFTGNTQNVCGVLVHQIRAVRDFGNVKSGDVGGWIEKELNLSHYDDCWVYENAIVTENAIVYMNALISGNAKISGNARIYDKAQICDNVCVFGTARVFNNAYVFGDAWIFGTAVVYGDVKISGKVYVSGDAELSANVEVIKTPINIIGLRYNVTMYNNYIKIGEELHTVCDWENFSDYEILSMYDAVGLLWWKENKKIILKLMMLN